MGDRDRDRELEGSGCEVGVSITLGVERDDGSGRDDEGSGVESLAFR